MTLVRKSPMKADACQFFIICGMANRICTKIETTVTNILRDYQTLYRQTFGTNYVLTYLSLRLSTPGVISLREYYRLST
ncbi:Uncharacterised protein [Shigella flexneri]|nr:Uncharacterised protein [Shigella flexneri]